MVTLSDLNKKHQYSIIILLIITVFVAYGALFGNEFVRFDDQDYIYENIYLQKGLSWEFVRWAFSLDNPKITYWHPLTWLSLGLDHQMFGLKPAGYHAVNLVIHIINALLLFNILRRSTARLWPSAAVAFLFALHPLNVESVAWAVERKTVLSSFFWFVAIICYLSYVTKPALSRYILLAAVFALGLLSKIMVVTLPFALLLLDIWPLGRMDWSWTNANVYEEGENKSLDFSRRRPIASLVLEKLPLMLLSGGAMAITIYSNLSTIVKSETNASFIDKGANALISYVVYIGKMFWPVKLAVYYPLPAGYPVWEVAAALLCLIGITVLAIYMRRNRPWFFVGWLWYLGVLFPVTGLVRSGLWPAMADRFTYLPLIGLFIIVVWGMTEIAERFPGTKRALVVGSCVLLAALIIRTHQQASYWKNTFTLFDHAAAVTTDNTVAYGNLGFYYFDRGEREKAYTYFLREQKSDPFNFDYEYALAQYCYDKDDMGGAELWLEKAFAKKNDDVTALNLFADILVKKGENNKAMAVLEQIIRSPLARDDIKSDAKRKVSRLKKQGGGAELNEMFSKVAANPKDFMARWELAFSLDRLGRYDEALNQYSEVERLGMRDWKLFYNLGNVNKKLRRFKDAIRYYEKTLELNQGYVDAMNNLGIAYREDGQPARAMEIFLLVMRRDPTFAFAPFQLAVTYYQQGDRANALRYFNFTKDNFPSIASHADPYLKKLDKDQ